MTRFERRSILRGAASVLAVGALAGCIGDDDDDGNGDDDGDDDTSRTPEEVAVDWASAADNFSGAGDIEDHTGADQVLVNNGERPGANYVYTPAVVRVDAGTEVVWDWVSSGHTVTLVDGQGATLTDWEDHDQLEDEGFEHSVTFDEAGVALYECAPHTGQNQRGAVIVE